jgi:hypothetical protein
MAYRTLRSLNQGWLQLRVSYYLRLFAGFLKQKAGWNFKIQAYKFIMDAVGIVVTVMH